MKKNIILPSLIVLLSLFWGCSHSKKDISPEHLTGNWISPVNTDNISGYDTLFLHPDEKLIMRQGINFIGSDSGFDFSAKAYTKIEGRWKLSNDTLSIMYYKRSLDMIWPDKEISVKYSGADSTRIIPESQKKEMLSDLRNALESNYKSQYNTLDSTYIMLGVIQNLTSSHLELSNKGQSITLVRIP